MAPFVSLSALIPGPHDGKVAVDKARVESMADFSSIDATHPFIMNSNIASEETLGFLETGAFDPPR